MPHPLVNVMICIVIGMVLTKTNPMTFGKILSTSLGSFLGQVGFIIMIGSGLGAILKESGVAENFVYLIVRKVGINSMNKAILASMLTSMVMVLVLSTLTGGNAVIAPIIIPLVASVGMTPSTLAIIMQTAGVTGLFISPFSPPMVTLMELTGLTYPQALLHASLPICIPMWLITYFNAKRVQKKTAGIMDYPAGTALSVDNYDATPEARRASILFSIVMVLVIIYGIVFRPGVSHAITVIFVAFLAVSFGARFKASHAIETFMKGCAQYFWIYILFILLDSSSSQSVVSSQSCARFSRETRPLVCLTFFTLCVRRRFRSSRSSCMVSAMIPISISSSTACLKDSEERLFSRILSRPFMAEEIAMGSISLRLAESQSA